MIQDIEQKLSELEALLFIHGEPFSEQKIAEVTGWSVDDVTALISEYRVRLGAADRGLSLITMSGRVQLATKPEFGSLLQRFVKSELSEDLSTASLETLALISYFGPLSRAAIDHHRGVNSSFILRTLMLRGLINRTTDPDHPQSYLYAPSTELFQHLGLASRDELPEREKFSALLERPHADAQGDTSASASAPAPSA